MNKNPVESFACVVSWTGTGYPYCRNYGHWTCNQIRRRRRLRHKKTKWGSGYVSIWSLDLAIDFASWNTPRILDFN